MDHGKHPFFQKSNETKVYGGKQKTSQEVLFSNKQQKYDELLRTTKGRGPKDGYLAGAVREFYPGLMAVRSGDLLFNKAMKLAQRCYEQKIKEDAPLAEDKSKKRARKTGVGVRLEFQMSVTQYLIGSSTFEQD